MPHIDIEANVVFEDTDTVFMVECIDSDGLKHRLTEKTFYQVVDETAHYYYIKIYGDPMIRAFSKNRFKKVAG